MAIPDVQATAFWKVYYEYEVERKALGQQKVQVINDYPANYSTLTDAMANEIAKAAMQKIICITIMCLQVLREK